MVVVLRVSGFNLSSFLLLSVHSLPSLLFSLSPYPPSQDDEFTHLYTFILRPDNTYEVKIDNKKVEGGPIEDDWDILLPKTILDPEAKKPEDWDDRAKIPDPEDTKPDVREN